MELHSPNESNNPLDLHDWAVNAYDEEEYGMAKNLIKKAIKKYEAMNEKDMPDNELRNLLTNAKIAEKMIAQKIFDAAGNSVRKAFAISRQSQPQPQPQPLPKPPIVEPPIVQPPIVQPPIPISRLPSSNLPGEHNIIYQLNKSKNAINKITHSNSITKNKILPILTNVSNSIDEAEKFILRKKGGKRARSIRRHKRNARRTHRKQK
uniref:Uncharacterized protein n=1 Tax=viral metagenome TaxID=1070528 RepID=A0A6C0KVF2_9ZZZZ